MNSLLKEISQISIYLKDEADRVNEVALFQPLRKQSHFDETNKTIAQRKWTYTAHIPFFQRLSLKVQKFLFKRMPFIIPRERVTTEAKFKTVLAMLLAQESVRDFFLSYPKRRNNFFHALQETARALGLGSFTCPTEQHPLTISRLLTKLAGKKKSLIDDLAELQLQMAALTRNERNEILYRLLNQIERPPITSVIEVSNHETMLEIPLTTQYAKYKILNHNPQTGKITYIFSKNRATSSIRTLENARPNAKGAMNQRLVIDNQTTSKLGFYSGELTTPFHVLEQLLFILGEEESEVFVVDSVSPDTSIQDVRVMFTSLFSWHELGSLTDQFAAIQNWDQKILKCKENYYKLDLLYFNIPFNALNKYPTPSELGAAMQEINDETMIFLTWEGWKKLGMASPELEAIAHRTEALRQSHALSFLEKQKLRLEEIDAFRKLKKTLLDQIGANETSFAKVLQALLSLKKENGKKLKGIDHLIYLSYLVKQLGYIHNKNCQNATDRLAGANASDKASYTFQKIRQKSFLPGLEDEEENSLFKVLYSMYLVWEEPEINTILSTGFLGEKFYHNFIQKNPETTLYLIRWLKKHPEMYLGLSDYRTH